MYLDRRHQFLQKKKKKKKKKQDKKKKNAVLAKCHLQRVCAKGTIFLAQSLTDLFVLPCIATGR